MTLVENHRTVLSTYVSANKPDCMADGTRDILPPAECCLQHTHDDMVKLLLKDLNKQLDVVIDFSSLKTCLNPMDYGNLQVCNY